MLFHEAQDRDEVGKHELHVTADEVGHAGHAALVRDVRELHLGHGCEKLAGEVRGGCRSRRREVDLSRSLARRCRAPA